MTLDEAIAHAREVATEQKRRSGACVINDNECDKFSACIKCAEEHEQLAEWLEELKAYRQQHIALCEKYDVNTVEELYVKGIDDFVSRLETVSFTKTQWDLIKIIAEQLKAGGVYDD